LKTVLAVLIATLSSVAWAGDQVTMSEASAVQLAIGRGELLYAYNQAAWHATDAMVAASKEDGSYDRVMKTGSGYVIKGDASAPTVSFYDRSDPPKVFFRARMSDGGTKIASRQMITPPEFATVNQQKFVQERSAIIQAASAARLGICAHATPNYAILPSIGNQGRVGYVMTPQMEPKSFPMGGHYRFDLQDGRAVNHRAFTKSCMTIALPPDNKDKPRLLTVTHLLDETPTELHVFTMLSAQLPLVVITSQNKKIWAVEIVETKARIRLLDKNAKVAAPTADK
jgi:hypothetical protein